jgi:hypothetical protein
LQLLQDSNKWLLLHLVQVAPALAQTQQLLPLRQQQQIAAGRRHTTCLVSTRVAAAQVQRPQRQHAIINKQMTLHPAMAAPRSLASLFATGFGLITLLAFLLCFQHCLQLLLDILGFQARPLCCQLLFPLRLSNGCCLAPGLQEQ